MHIYCVSIKEECILNNLKSLKYHLCADLLWIENSFVRECISVVKIVTAIHDSLGRDFPLYIYTFTGKCIIVKWGLAIFKGEAFWRKHFVIYKIWSPSGSILRSKETNVGSPQYSLKCSVSRPPLMGSSTCPDVPSDFEFSKVKCC